MNSRGDFGWGAFVAEPAIGSSLAGADDAASPLASSAGSVGLSASRTLLGSRLGSLLVLIGTPPECCICSTTYCPGCAFQGSIRGHRSRRPAAPSGAATLSWLRTLSWCL